MPEHNKILPKEKLSSRERVERKIKSFEGRPFTLRELNKLLRPRMRLEALRFHVENLVNNLHVEKLPREGREPQIYVARDVLKDIENEAPLSGAAHSFLVELYSRMITLREGGIVPQEELTGIRTQIRERSIDLQQEVEDLLKLHDCIDLWSPSTLVGRLGFLEDE